MASGSLPPPLDSIFAQSFDNFELIAVDDRSSDNTPAILADYAAREPRMRVITNPANRKLPASLNVGFAEAKGSWLSWTSDDNLLLPDMLARLVKARDSNPDADIIHADYRIIDENGAERSYVTTGPASDLVIDNTIGCCFLYRRDVDAGLGGYDEKPVSASKIMTSGCAPRITALPSTGLPVRLIYIGATAAALPIPAPVTFKPCCMTGLMALSPVCHVPICVPAPRFRLATRNPYSFRPQLLLTAFADSSSRCFASSGGRSCSGCEPVWA